MASTQDCENWPKGIPTLFDCCDTNEIFTDYIIHNCSRICNSNKTKTSSCVANCYAESKSILSDGKLDISAVRKELQSRHSFFDKEYSDSGKTFAELLEKCEKNITETNDILQQLLNLKYCLKLEASKNCPYFNVMKGCLQVEKFFEDCRREKETCKNWPKRFENSRITLCCHHPKLFSSEELDECALKCTFSSVKYYCGEHCKFKKIKSRIIKDGNFNREALKVALKENHNPNVNWDKAIDESLDICLSIMEGYSFKFT